MVLKQVSKESGLVGTKFTNRAKPVGEVVDVVNYAFQSVLEAHDLDPLERVLLEKPGHRGDQPNGIVVIGCRGPNVHGPISTRVP